MYVDATICKEQLVVSFRSSCGFTTSQSNIRAFFVIDVIEVLCVIYGL